MTLTPHLWRTLTGEVVVSEAIPMTDLPGHYDIRHRTADDEDLLIYEFLKPEHEQTEELYFQ